MYSQVVKTIAAAVGALTLAACVAPKQAPSWPGPGGAGQVWLESRWYAGFFGDGKPAWTGGNARNDMSILTHIPTGSHFFIYVRSYPGLNPDSPTQSKTNYLSALAEALVSEFHGQGASQLTKSLVVDQLRPGYQHCKHPFTFLVLQYSSTDPRSDPYGKSDTFSIVRYLADVRSDDDSPTPSGTVFQVCAAAPSGTPPETMQGFTVVIEDFLQNHVRLNQKLHAGESRQR